MGSGNAALDALHPQIHQGVCGDAIATMEGITREALDALALVSQERAARAIRKAASTSRWSPVYNEDGTVALDHEEFPRPETTAEGPRRAQAQLRRARRFRSGGGTTFRKQINRRYPDLEIEHVHHAGNSSGVVDGAAAILITSKDYADKHGLKPRGRIVCLCQPGR